PTTAISGIGGGDHGRADYTSTGRQPRTNGVRIAGQPGIRGPWPSSVVDMYGVRRRVRSGSGRVAGHLAQALDPRLDRRVGREEAGDELAAERVDDEQVRGGRVDVERDALRPRLQLLQCRGQQHRV